MILLIIVSMLFVYRQDFGMILPVQSAPCLVAPASLRKDHSWSTAWQWRETGEAKCPQNPGTRDSPEVP